MNFNKFRWRDFKTTFSKIFLSFTLISRPAMSCYVLLYIIIDKSCSTFQQQEVLYGSSILSYKYFSWQLFINANFKLKLFKTTTSYINSPADKFYQNNCHGVILTDFVRLFLRKGKWIDSERMFWLNSSAAMSLNWL